MNRVLSTLGGMLAMVGVCAAGELNRAHVPADAQWVVHIDFEALRDSTLVKHLHKMKPDAFEKARGWLKERYGIDPQEDLKAMTVFGTSYEPHSGTAILWSKYDREKVQALLEKQPGFETMTWNDHKLYTWETTHKHHGARGGQTREITGVLLNDETTIFAASQKKVRTAVKLIQGDSPSLDGQESSLIGDIPAGMIFYGAATSLEDLAEHYRPFPVLEQHKEIKVIFGEHDGDLFETVTLVGKNEKVAGQMKAVLEGLVAMGKVVIAPDSEKLMALYDKTEIEQDGATVCAEWTGGVEETLSALHEAKPRLEALHKHHHERRHRER